MMPFNLGKIGQLLREAREKMGLTVDEVSNTLFIREWFLAAIEAGDWDNLPHPVYVKGYVTQYAIFLGIRDLIESEVPSRANELPVQGREGVSQRKEGIFLKRWQFRKRGPQENQPMYVPWSVIDQLNKNY